MRGAGERFGWRRIRLAIGDWRLGERISNNIGDKWMFSFFGAEVALRRRKDCNVF